MRTFEEIATSEVVLAQGLIRYRQLGVGEPIVLVHGLLTNSLLWAPVAQRLAQDSFVPIDQPERTASLIGEFARPKGASVQAGSR